VILLFENLYTDLLKQQIISAFLLLFDMENLAIFPQKAIFLIYYTAERLVSANWGTSLPGGREEWNAQVLIYLC